MGGGAVNSSRLRRRPAKLSTRVSRAEERLGSDRTLRTEPGPTDLEMSWKIYTHSDEFLKFRMLIQALRQLPPVEEIAESRAEFEFLLHALNKLGDCLEIERISKAYRSHYSPEVQLSGYLYSTLLTAFTLLPSYVLNGQEFYVSDTVLDQCQSLQFVFQTTCDELTSHFLNLQPYSLDQVRNDAKRSLIYFDRSWCRFEMPALEEIEAIHRQACRPLIEAIQTEQSLVELEQAGGGTRRVNGSDRVRLEVQRNRFMERVCELNQLANIDGKGRADMDMTCVMEAEKIAAMPMRRGPEPWWDMKQGPSGEERAARKGKQGALVEDGSVTDLRHGFATVQLGCAARSLKMGGGGASPVLVRIAQALLQKLDRLRRLFRRYSRCLYQVNSHLANNADLVRGMEKFEESWEMANKYLVQESSRRLVRYVYNLVSFGVQDERFQSSLRNHRAYDPEFLISSLPNAMLLYEMCPGLLAGRRGANNNAASWLSGNSSKLKNAAHAAALRAAKGGRAPSSQAPGGGFFPSGSASQTLPRPLLGVEDGSIEGGPGGAQPRCAPGGGGTTHLQRSLIAKSFLPPDMAGVYDRTSEMLEKLTEVQLEHIRTALVTPTLSNLNPTPPPTTGAANGGSTQDLLLAGGRYHHGGDQYLGANDASSSSNGSPGGLERRAASAGPERGPAARPPCPPRMAVPNTTTPQQANMGEGGATSATGGPLLFHSGAAGQGRQGGGRGSQQPGEESDEEEDEGLSIDLSALRRESARLNIIPAAQPILAPPAAAVAAAPNNDVNVASDAMTREVMSNLSNLSMQMQRHDPQAWNGLVQVVLQGVMFAEKCQEEGNQLMQLGSLPPKPRGLSAKRRPQPAELSPPPPLQRGGRGRLSNTSSQVLS